MFEKQDVTLIFGGTGGIGAALARACQKQGRRVHLAARDAARLQSLADATGATWSVADATQPDQVEAAVAAAQAAGALGGLAYCVGSIDLRPLGKVDAEAMLAAYRLNVVGAALAVRAAAEALKENRGAVVLFSSIAAAQGFTNHVITAAAKGGVEALTRSLAADLAPQVRVNCVAPSLTDTPLAAAMTGNATLAKTIAGLHPLPRLGTPADMAAAAAFLLGPDSGWMTGEVLRIDGGRSSLRVKG